MKGHLGVSVNHYKTGDWTRYFGLLWLYDTCNWEEWGVREHTVFECWELRVPYTCTLHHSDISIVVKSLFQATWMLESLLAPSLVFLRTLLGLLSAAWLLGFGFQGAGLSHLQEPSPAECELPEDLSKGLSEDQQRPGMEVVDWRMVNFFRPFWVNLRIFFGHCGWFLEIQSKSKMIKCRFLWCNHVEGKVILRYVNMYTHT